MNNRSAINRFCSVLLRMLSVIGCLIFIGAFVLSMFFAYGGGPDFEDFFKGIFYGLPLIFYWWIIPKHWSRGAVMTLGTVVHLVWLPPFINLVTASSDTAQFWAIILIATFLVFVIYAMTLPRLTTHFSRDAAVKESEPDDPH